jgi:hypothetical protein
MGIRSRLVAATMAVATLTAVVGMTTAAASPSAAAGQSAAAPGKPDKPGKPIKPIKPVNPGKPGGGVDSAALAKVAASLRVSVPQLTAALDNLKRALAQGASKSTALAGFAKELGVSVARAEQALRKLSGASGQKPGPKPGVPEAAIRSLASKLHISVGRARAVYAELATLPDKSGDITANPGFVAIAKRLGITPRQLRSVLIEVKLELAGKSAPGGSPTK